MLHHSDSGVGQRKVCCITLIVGWGKERGGAKKGMLHHSDSGMGQRKVCCITLIVGWGKERYAASL